MQALQLSTSRESFAPQHCSIVGMALRYPGKSGRQAFWEAAISNTDVQQQVPYSRWSNDAKYSPDLKAGKMTTSTRYKLVARLLPELLR